MASSPRPETTANSEPVYYHAGRNSYHSPSNRIELGKILEQVILPKKGRLTVEEKAVEGSEEFVRMRRRHSAVESAINGLEHHGLDL